MKTKYFKKIILAVLASFAALPGMAIDYWTVGKVQAVLVGGEATEEAGSVFVSAEAVEEASDIAGVASTMQTEPVVLTGASGSSAINKTYYFYAKANPGYTFIGFASTATGSPSGSGLAEAMALTGDYYTYSAKAGAGWSANTAETAKVFARYAVFEKTGGEGTGDGDGDGDGDQDTATEAKVVSVTNQYGKNLVNAELTYVEGESADAGDMVTHIYITFDHELKEISTMAAHRELASKITLVNTTTGMSLNFNQYSCGVTGNDKHVLDMFLSTDSYINSKDYLGVYVVTVPAGVATTTNNLPTEAYTFSFKYVDGSGDSTPEAVVLDDYLGNWKQVVQAGEEVANPAAFTFEKVRDAYFITNLYATTLKLPLTMENGKYYLANTESDGCSFTSAAGNAVQVVFHENEGKKQIYLDQFTLQSAAFAEPVVGGVCYFEYTEDSIPTPITAVGREVKTQTVYDLQGRRLSSPVRGVSIVNGKKYIQR